MSVHACATWAARRLRAGSALPAAQRPAPAPPRNPFSALLPAEDVAMLGRGLLVLATLAAGASARGLYDHQVYDIAGEQVNLNRFSGRFALVVNIHPTDPHWKTQLAWMARETLKHKNFGFEMLLVPADEFPSGGHNLPPLHNREVQRIIEEELGNNHGMQLLAKSHVNGKCPPSAVPNEAACASESTHCCAGNDKVYEAIRHQPRGVPKVQTNFAKFLIGPKGQLVARFEGREPLHVRGPSHIFLCRPFPHNVVYPRLCLWWRRV